MAVLRTASADMVDQISELRWLPQSVLHNGNAKVEVCQYDTLGLFSIGHMILIGMN